MVDRPGFLPEPHASSQIHGDVFRPAAANERSAHGCVAEMMEAVCGKADWGRDGNAGLVLVVCTAEFPAHHGGS